MCWKILICHLINVLWSMEYFWKSLKSTEICENKHIQHQAAMAKFQFQTYLQLALLVGIVWMLESYVHKIHPKNMHIILVLLCFVTFVEVWNLVILLLCFTMSSPAPGQSCHSVSEHISGLILGLQPANERCCCKPHLPLAGCKPRISWVFDKPC